MKKLKISPSMMCADFIHLQNDLDVMVSERIDYLHIDVMDGHYVPNFTLGPDYCRAVAEYSLLPLDIHLMIEDVDKYLPDFAAIPKAMVSFHPETCYHPIRTIQTIKKFGAKAGIAIDPGMSIESVKHLLPEVDMVCVMTVSPGYAGQKLIPHALSKLTELSTYIQIHGFGIELEVDGNVSWENIPAMVQAGAEIFVAGTSSLFDKKQSLEKNISRFHTMLNAPEISCRKLPSPQPLSPRTLSLHCTELAEVSKGTREICFRELEPFSLSPLLPSVGEGVGG